MSGISSRALNHLIVSSVDQHDKSWYKKKRKKKKSLTDQKEALRFQHNEMVAIGTFQSLFQPPELGLTFLVDKAEISKKPNKYNLHDYMTAVNIKFLLELKWSVAWNLKVLDKAWWASVKLVTSD